MDKNQAYGFGAIVMAAVAILIGLAFWGQFAGNIGQMTKTSAAVNVSMTLPADGATSELTMCGQKALTIAIINQSDRVVVPTSNYTTSQSPGTDGYLAAKVTTTSSLLFAGKAVNVSCTYEPKGYIAESGSRGIVVVISIFMALLILVAAMPNVREFIVDKFS